MKKKIPVAIGGLYDVLIDDLSHDGLGIARIDGFLVFVKDALPGERVVARITNTKKNYGHGLAIDKIKTAATRVQPLCSLFEACGGCQIQHMNYASQLEFKKNIVVRNMQKFAKIENPPVLDVIGMDDPWRYRNKTQVPFGLDENGEIVAGFYKSRSHEIIDMSSCLVQTRVADDIVAAVKKFACEFGISPYIELQHEGVLRHVVIRVGFKTDQVMVVFVTRTPDLPHKEPLCQHLINKFPSIKSIAHNINPQVTNVIFGEQTNTIYGEDYIKDFLDGLDFLISARSFYQVNPVQTEVLYRIVAQYANIGAADIVFDAYCGIGTITLFLAREAAVVYGVEIAPDAIVDAKENARINGLDNVNFEVGASEVVIPRLINEGIVPDVIVVDPPRKGCDVTLLEAIICAKPERVVYVSCDSATLARDVKVLEEGGYKLEIMQPIDLFPMTSHVECVALISRKSRGRVEKA